MKIKNYGASCHQSPCPIPHCDYHTEDVSVITAVAQLNIHAIVHFRASAPSTRKDKSHQQVTYHLLFVLRQRRNEIHSSCDETCSNMVLTFRMIKSLPNYDNVVIDS